MVFFENPDITTLPSIPKIARTESIKGSLDSASAPTVTIKDKFNDLDSNKSVKTQFQLEEHPVDTVRPIKVGIIGAGLAGITAGVLLPAKLPGLDLRIYDKNADAVRYGDFPSSGHILTTELGRHMVDTPLPEPKMPRNGREANCGG